MPQYTPWTWSPPHGRHYMYLLSDDGLTILDTLWAGPSDTGSAAASAVPLATAQAESRPTAIAQSYSHRTLPAVSQSYSPRTAPTVLRTQGSSSAAWSHHPLVERGNDEEEDEDDEYENENEDEDSEDEDEQERSSEAQYQNEGANVDRGKHDSGYGLPNLTGLNIGGPSMAPAPRASSTPHGPQYTVSYAGQNTNQTSQYYTSPTAQSTQHFARSTAVPNPAVESSENQQNKRPVATLPPQIQAQLKSLERRYIQTDASTNNAEVLDARYRRVATPHHGYFFTPGRVFKMLWSEPAGQANPGKTRNSTHFSTVWLNEEAFSEIRHFVVVRNKGTFSQCIPIQTYKGRGAAKPGLIMADHGIIHTSQIAPNQVQGEALTKYSIRVEPAKGESLLPASRVNYGKAYAVEHNVKVLDVGMVTKNHRYLLSQYFDAAMTGN